MIVGHQVRAPPLIAVPWLFEIKSRSPIARIIICATTEPEPGHTGSRDRSVPISPQDGVSVLD